MSCTRNINTPGNYKLERRQQNAMDQYRTNIAFSTPENTNLPGNGLLHSWLPNTQMSNNAVDTESFLRGIGSTNLMDPQPQFVPEPRTHNIEQLHLFETRPIIMPVPMVIEKNQRPGFP
jgi:hypothetical protein